AITWANSTGQNDTIRLDAVTYSLTFNNDADGPNGLPSITSDVTIEGAGRSTTILQRVSSPTFFRLMHVGKTGNLTVDRLTLNGGDISFRSGSGIYNNGALTIMRSNVMNNGGVNSGLGG